MSAYNAEVRPISGDDVHKIVAGHDRALATVYGFLIEDSDGGLILRSMSEGSEGVSVPIDGVWIYVLINPPDEYRRSLIARFSTAAKTTSDSR